MLKLLCGWLSFVTVNAIPIRSLQMVGMIQDSHGCVTDGGYQWCETTQSCERPWLTPCVDPCLSQPCLNGGSCRTQSSGYTCVCPSGYKGTTCSTSMLGTDTTMDSSLGERCAIGFCENPKDCPQCQAGLTCHVPLDLLCAGTCYGTCMSHGPIPVVDPLPVTTQIPATCLVWYDGCNTCQVLNGQSVGCTRRMCFTKGTPVCQRYNHHRRLLTNRTLNQTNQSV
jgi:hypothetical protein